jgi:hypothetical protein
VVTAGEKEHPVEAEVARAGSLVQVNVATAAVVGGKVKDEADTLNGPLGHLLPPKIAVKHLDRAVIDEVRDVLDPAAAQIVDDPDARATSD